MTFAQRLGLPSPSYIYRGISAYASKATTDTQTQPNAPLGQYPPSSRGATSTSEGKPPAADWSRGAAGGDEVGVAGGFYPYLPPALQPFSAGGSASDGANSSGAVPVAGGFAPFGGGGLLDSTGGPLGFTGGLVGSSGGGGALMGHQFSSGSSPYFSPNNPSASNHNSALQDNRSWFQSGEMVVFVLILNLGFTALFAHLLSS